MSSSVAVAVTVPLTTIYTPPASCSSARLISIVPNEDFFRTALNEVPVDCYEPGTGVVDPSDGLGSPGTVYSPGVCPSGFTGYQETDVIASTSTTVYTSYCCPSGLVWHQTVKACYEPQIVWSQNFGSTITGAWRVKVMWESSDLQNFTPLAAPLITTTPSTQAAASTSTSGNTGKPPSSKPTQSSTSTPIAGPNNGGDSSLSTGAKAGIGVGIALGCILAVSAIAMFFLYRKRQKTNAVNAASTPNSRDSPDANNEWPAPAYSDNPRNDGQAYEMHRYQKPSLSEMEGSPPPRSELSGGWEGHEVRHRAL